MKLIANRQLTGSYGTVSPGDEFEADDALARDLILRELARRAEPPRILYETKPMHFETQIVRPEAPEVSPRPPFRDLSVSDQEPAPVAPASNPVLPEPDVPAEGTPDPGRRGRRKGFGASR